MEALILSDLLNYNSKSNFTISFVFLPKNKRDAINLVYNWCKVSDSIVDAELPNDRKKQFLHSWVVEFEKGLLGNSQYPILNKLSIVIHKFQIPTEYFLDLLRGMEMDLTKNRYNTFNELEIYCYCVASTVGLICAKIFGYKNEAIEKYAIQLGKALQITNIIRDIKQDATKGRIYIPLEDLQKFNVDEKDIFENRMSDNLRKCINYQWERANQYFTETDKLLVVEEKKGFLAAQIMEEVYYSILLKIRENNYDVFTSNLKVSSYNKFKIAISCWWKNR
ncbi:MAG: squalene synthase HpnD [Ignavibacteria bacterium]|nr:squalene synthase HpnD [Bacteroidota bacterium]MSQ45845.1 squalene synthase HpnD [Ignavibacteria bacterium]